MKNVLIARLLVSLADADFEFGFDYETLQKYNVPKSIFKEIIQDGSLDKIFVLKKLRDDLRIIETANAEDRVANEDDEEYVALINEIDEIKSW